MTAVEEVVVTDRSLTEPLKQLPHHYEIDRASFIAILLVCLVLSLFFVAIIVFTLKRSDKYTLFYDAVRPRGFCLGGSCPQPRNYNLRRVTHPQPYIMDCSYKWGG